MSGSKSMGSLMSEMEPVLMKKQTDPPVTKLKLTPRAARREESSHTKNDLAAFERSHHDLVEIENMTKEELIGMITREGLEMPGAVTFDSEQNVYVKERLKKREYLEFIRQELYKTDVPAMCKKGKKLGKVSARRGLALLWDEWLIEARCERPRSEPGEKRARLLLTRREALLSHSLRAICCSPGSLLSLSFKRRILLTVRTLIPSRSLHTVCLLPSLSSPLPP